MDKNYICVGENHREGVKMGRCGDIRTLKEWIIELFGEQAEQAIEFLKGDKIS